MWIALQGPDRRAATGQLADGVVGRPLIGFLVFESSPTSMGTLQRLAQLLGRSPQARVRRLKSECTSLGEGATVQGSPFVENEGTIRIGRRARLSAHLGPTRLRTGAGAELRIGDDADI